MLNYFKTPQIYYLKMFNHFHLNLVFRLNNIWIIVCLLIYFDDVNSIFSENKTENIFAKHEKRYILKASRRYLFIVPFNL